MIRLALPAAAAATLALALLPAPAAAQELFGGVYAHDVDWVTDSGIEDGTDIELGWRGPRILPALGGPRPHVFVSGNTAGDTSFAAAGISWRLGETLYVRPGIGVAVHTGRVRFDRRRERIGFGSPVLFEPELGIGYQVNERLSVEASWVHLSHAKLLSHNNPGLDTVGVRLNWRLR